MSRRAPPRCPTTSPASSTAIPPPAPSSTSLDSRNRYAILYRIQDAKRPATRARRIETFVAMLARGERIHN